MPRIQFHQAHCLRAGAKPCFWAVAKILMVGRGRLAPGLVKECMAMGFFMDSSWIHVELWLNYTNYVQFSSIMCNCPFCWHWSVHLRRLHWFEIVPFLCSAGTFPMSHHRTHVASGCRRVGWWVSATFGTCFLAVLSTFVITWNDVAQQCTAYINII